MNPITRRNFLKGGALAAAASLIPGSLLSYGQSSLGDIGKKPLRIACVGVGGRGGVNVRRFVRAGARVVALCDVDFVRGRITFGTHPEVPRYKDYREMLEEMDKEIDAVVISTPDHMHFPIAMLSLQRGKHVYVEKPATHTIGEGRALKAAAIASGCVAQMGNQGHSSEGIRLIKEWVEAGVLGQVTEVHCWTDRPVWPQDVDLDRGYVQPPKTLDWNLWLGVAPYREFAPGIVPIRWRGLWEYGCGAIGDMGCHTLDAPCWALNLTGPVKVYAEFNGSDRHMTTMSKGARITYEYPARGNLAPVKVVWFEGDMQPPKPKDMAENAKLSSHGLVMYGDKGTLLDESAYARAPRLIPAPAMAAFRDRPHKSIPRVPSGNNYLEFITACQGGPQPGSSLKGFGADLNEMTLLGSLALRTGKVIDWDPVSATCKGMPELDRFINKSYRSF